MSPIKLLEKTLNSLERDLKKSLESYKKGKITHETFELHIENIGPVIREYREAIQLLNQ
jgi:hypothetical protein